MTARKTLPEELQRVNELFSVAFEYSGEGPFDEKEKNVTHWAAFHEGGEMMSTLTVSDYQILFDGCSCKMGGIGGVATLPQYRRQGGIRACFEKALPDMYAGGYDFSYLFPFSTAYYRKFGYENCVQRYRCTVDIGQLVPHSTDGFFRLVEKNCPLTESIRAVDAAWEKKYNMTVLHTPEDYGWVEKLDPFKTLEYTFVWFSADGTPKSFTTFKTVTEPDGRNLKCSQFLFNDREGFYGLMEIFRSVGADHKFAKFEVPALAGMQYMLPEWSLGAASWTVVPAGMVRVINVRSVLEKARYNGSGTVTLRIRDKFIPENDGCFEVKFEDGAAVSVAPVSSGEDATLDVSAFSALIAGVCDFSGAAQWMPGIEVIYPDAPLDKVFMRKPLAIVDYF